MACKGEIIPPAPVCAICGRPLSETGGCRLIGQQTRWVGYSPHKSNERGPKVFSRTVPLGEKGDGYALVRGEESFCTEEAVQRVYDALKSGLRPWFCQHCGRRVCYKCGAPINMPVGSAHMQDDGCTGNCPILGVGLGCSNPDCSLYHPVERYFPHKKREE